MKRKEHTVSAKKQSGNGPRTGFGKFMVYKFIPQYSNNVQGLVYMGAAFLIIIVGLRGLGELAGQIAIVPRFLLEGKKVSPNWVMVALFLEFALLMVMAITTFFTPEEPMFDEPTVHKGDMPSDELQRIKNQMAEIKSLAKSDIDTLNEYLESINNVNRKLAQSKSDFLKSLGDLRQLFKQ